MACDVGLFLTVDCIGFQSLPARMLVTNTSLDFELRQHSLATFAKDSTAAFTS